MADFIGFHGTSSRNAELIMKDDFLINDTVGWLGTGVYFYEENYELARYFANTFSSEGAVIRCEISVPDEQVLDVTVPGSDQSGLFHETRTRLIEQEIRRHRVDMLVRNKKNLDGIVFNILGNTKGYKLIRSFSYTYQDYDRKYKLGASRVPNGIELCLKDIQCIRKKHVV